MSSLPVVPGTGVVSCVSEGDGVPEVVVTDVVGPPGVELTGVLTAGAE